MADALLQPPPPSGGDPKAPQHELAVGALIDRIPKVVFSSTLSTDEWLTTVRPIVAAEEVAALRDQADGGVVIFGSGRVVQAIGRLGLIDEYQLLIQPVALGAGLPLFEPGRKVDLVLATPAASGLVDRLHADVQVLEGGLQSARLAVGVCEPAVDVAALPGALEEARHALRFASERVRPARPAARAVAFPVADQRWSCIGRAWSQIGGGATCLANTAPTSCPARHHP